MELWTAAHARTLLPAFVVMILAAFAIHAWIGNKDIRVRKIPLKIIAVLLILLEIGKQIDSASRGYSLYHLPFHFCSLLLFAVPAMAFYRGKHSQRVDNVVSSICAAVFILTMVYPSLIYSAENIAAFWVDFQSFHTVAFHNLAVFAFILIITLRLPNPAQNGDGRAILLCIFCFCVVSATMAQVLQTNYNNFYSCNIAPLESLRVSLQSTLGYGVTQVLYILIVTVLDILFVQMSYWVCRVLSRLMEKKKSASCKTVQG